VKKRNAFTILFSILLILVFTATALLAACAKPEPTPAPSPAPAPQPTPAPAPKPEPITLKAVTFLPGTMFAVKGIHYLVEEAPARSNGELIVDYLGGPEVISGFDQAEAVKKNIVQIACLPCTYYVGLVPLAEMPNLSQMSNEEEKASGAHDYMDELHQKVGLKLLWRSAGSDYSDNFQPVLTKKISKPSDFSKIKMGATATFMKPYLDSVGGTLTIIPTPDAYTSLERGVVDGFVWPLVNSINLSFYEVADYVLDPPFMAGNAYFIMNLDAWNNMPGNLQDLLMGILMDQRKQYQVDWDKQVAATRQKALDNGMEFITFSEADAKAYFDGIYVETWEWAEKQYPDVAPKLRSLLGQ